MRNEKFVKKKKEKGSKKKKNWAFCFLSSIARNESEPLRFFSVVVIVGCWQSLSSDFFFGATINRVFQGWAFVISHSTAVEQCE